MDQLVELFAGMVRASSGARTSVLLRQFESSQNLPRYRSVAVMRECQERGHIVAEVRFGVEYLSWVR